LLSEGRVFGCVCRAGETWGTAVTERVVWRVVKDCAKRAAIGNLASPHDLRRTCAACVAKPDKIWTQSNSCWVGLRPDEGAVSRLQAAKQRIRAAVNDRIGIEP